MYVHTAAYFSLEKVVSGVIVLCCLNYCCHLVHVITHCGGWYHWWFNYPSLHLCTEY